MALQNQLKRTVRFARFGDFAPGQSGADVEFAQRSLVMLGFDVPITGKYEARTSAAVLEFRGASGLPYVDRIDDAFLERLYAESDAHGDTSRLPKTDNITPGAQPDINIGGSGMLSLFALLIVGYVVSRKKRRK